MAETSFTLLERLRLQPDADSWKRLVDLYTPLIHGWLRRHALQQPDADDLVQEVLTVLVRDLPQFRYNRQRGAFRSWLRTITVHRLRNFWRSRQHRPLATGASDIADLLGQLEDAHSDLSQLWDQEHDRHVVRRMLELIAPEFTSSTWRAFHSVAVEGKKEDVVAAELGISVNAVFIAKSRVLNRLRRETQGLID